MDSISPSATLMRASSPQKRGTRCWSNQTGKGYETHGNCRDRFSHPVSVCAVSATPHEVNLVEETLRKRLVRRRPEKLIGDKAYDSDPLDAVLAQKGVELIAPHKSNRIAPRTQDGRKLRRYKRRWRVERLFAWLQNFRRIATRYDYHIANFIGFVYLGCILLFLRYL